jgi:hypothetical protein
MLILLFFISILLRYKSRNKILSQDFSLSRDKILSRDSSRDKKISQDKSRDKILSRDESRDSLSRDRGMNMDVVKSLPLYVKQLNP